MRVEQIKKLLIANPFRSFSIELVNDRQVFVRHRDYAWFQEDERTLWVEEEDGSATIIDTLLVQAVVVEKPSREGGHEG